MANAGLKALDERWRYWQESVRAAVAAWEDDHERRMAADPQYRRQQEALAAEYERIFNNSRQMVEGDL